MQDAKCDLVLMGTIVKDTTLILQTARKSAFTPVFCGNFASYSTAVAETPGEPADGFFSMAPALYRYPDDPTPAVQDVCKRYRAKYGFDINYLGEAGISCASFVVDALKKAGRDLTLDSFVGALESMKDWRDVFGGPALSMSATNHHASNQSFLSVIKGSRWVPVVETALSY